MAKTRFEWDANKNLANERKHGVDFETAARAFADPLALSEQDRIEDGEARWWTLGLVEGHLSPAFVARCRQPVKKHARGVIVD